MFSWKNFSWKKWGTLSLLFFLLTWTLAYYHLDFGTETREQLLTMPSVVKRLLIAMTWGLVISLFRTEPKQ
jgi:hypothetical protein